MEPLPELTLDTTRLVLRPFSREDAPAVQAACDDPETRRWLPLPDPYDRAAAEEWVNDGAQRERRSGGGYTLAAADRETGRLVGSFSLHHVPRPGRAEIGYWVAPWARGRGYATEATRRIAAYGFEALLLPRIQIRAAADNLPSQWVAARAGFRAEGLLRGADQHPSGRRDMVVYGRTAGDSGDPVLPFPLPVDVTDGVLALRPLDGRDVEAVYLVTFDPVGQRRLPRPAPEISERAARSIITTAGRTWLDGTMARFVAAQAATGTVVGDVVVRPQWGGTQQAMLGWSVLPEHRGRGYAKRTVRLAMRWAFGQAGYERLIAGVEPDNVASLRVAEAVGMRREAVAAGALPPLVAGPRRDCVLFGVLRDEWTDGVGDGAAVAAGGRVDR
ncbi:MAG: GNAT family N-acetyltransferase [Mycobacteriales bacterium]